MASPVATGYHPIYGNTMTQRNPSSSENIPRASKKFVTRFSTNDGGTIPVTVVEIEMDEPAKAKTVPLWAQKQANKRFGKLKKLQ